MAERKEVIIQDPFTIIDDNRERLTTMCFLHSVEIHLKQHNGKWVVELVLTDESYDLPTFASMIHRYIDGPADKLEALCKDLSTLDLTA